MTSRFFNVSATAISSGAKKTSVRGANYLIFHSEIQTYPLVQFQHNLYSNFKFYSIFYIPYSKALFGKKIADN
jgi:hypothetical protein